MTQTIFYHLGPDHRIVELPHHDRSMVLLDIFTRHGVEPEKVGRLPEVTAVLERIIVSVE